MLCILIVSRGSRRGLRDWRGEEEYVGGLVCVCELAGSMLVCVEAAVGLTACTQWWVGRQFRY